MTGFRRLTPSDVDLLLSVRRKALSTDPAAFRFTSDDDLAFSRSVWERRLSRESVFIFETTQGVLAMGGWLRMDGMHLQHKGLVWGIYVAPAARGQRLADALMDRLIEDATGKVRQLQLTVMVDNRSAIALYERCGFHTYAIEPASICRDGAYVDEVLMLRWL